MFVSDFVVAECGARDDLFAQCQLLSLPSVVDPAVIELLRVFDRPELLTKVPVVGFGGAALQPDPSR